MEKTSGFAIAALVLGIISLFLGWIPVFGQILCLLAIIFGIIPLFGNKSGKGMAIAGLVLGVVMLIIGLIFFAALGSVFSDSNHLTEKKVKAQSLPKCPSNAPYYWASDKMCHSVLESTEITNEDSLQQCEANIMQAECQKYGLIYTDYSEFAKFITCTKEGSYTVDDINNPGVYLQVYAPKRSLEKACGAYTAPTGKEGCVEQHLSTLCGKEGLIYTDYSEVAEFATCTDDGFYVMNDLSDAKKYQQVHIKQDALDAICENMS